MYRFLEIESIFFVRGRGAVWSRIFYVTLILTLSYPFCDNFYLNILFNPKYLLCDTSFETLIFVM